ncbi:hypothetical protein [Nostoc sp.]
MCIAIIVPVSAIANWLLDKKIAIALDSYLMYNVMQVCRGK